jgi:hypothetical protein
VVQCPTIQRMYNELDCLEMEKCCFRGATGGRTHRARPFPAISTFSLRLARRSLGMRTWEKYMEIFTEVHYYLLPSCLSIMRDSQSEAIPTPVDDCRRMADRQLTHASLTERVYIKERSHEVRERQSIFRCMHKFKPFVHMSWSCDVISYLRNEAVQG